MAKRLNTTIAVSDPETGDVTVLTPSDKLQAGDISYLEELWGKRAGDFLVEDEEAEPSEERRALGSGPLPSDPLRDDLPQPDRVPDMTLAEESAPKSVEEGQAKIQDANAEANDSRATKTGQGGRTATSK